MPLSNDNIQEELTLLQKYDLLVHIIEESSLSLKERLKGITALFSTFSPEQDEYPYDEYITEYVLEEYAYARSLGLSIADSAYSAKVSATLFNEALFGVKVSLATFVNIAKAELYGQATMKRKHLGKLDTASADGALKGTIAFLEKIYPREYGQKASLELSANDDFKKMWQIEVTHVETQPKETPK